MELIKNFQVTIILRDFWFKFKSLLSLTSVMDYILKAKNNSRETWNITY